MREDVISLFHEVADLPFSARLDYYSSHQILPEIQDELESLLKFDTQTVSLSNQIAETAQEVLQASSGVTENKSFGRYGVIRLLGQGGMGAVYLAERTDGEVEQQVAIKVVHSGTNLALFEDRFLRERRILASLNHPGVARLFDAGHTGDGRPYLVMEYVNGVSIDEYCAPLGLREVLKLFLAVCDAVAYAHRNLIIHRDLKPSNILVDGSGRPKLLDFGIARIIDDTDEARTQIRVLTPEYASPEQTRGEAYNTATDIYSLAAVLRKLATKVEIPTDIEFILRKAMRIEPEERYVTVDAFAEDVQAFLDNRPVQARSSTGWYRARKFLRRYWIPVAAATAVTASLALGLYIANRERVIAQQRFSQVRDLSNQVFKLDDQIQNLPGSTKARHALVALSLEYLERLGRQARGDKDLALEIGSAYLSVAEVQGVPGNSNLGDLTAADDSLAKADMLIDSVLAAAPRNQTALLRSASIAHDRMIVADTLRHPDQALGFARQCAARLETLSALNDSANRDPDVSRLYINVALAESNLHRLDDAVLYARRGVDIARRANRNDFVASALSVLSNALRYHGDLEEALKTTEEARLVQEARPDDFGRENNLIVVIWRAARILGEDEGINLDRPAEAVAALETAYKRSDQLARRDAADYGSRERFVAAACDLGDILRHSDPVRALEVYDAGLSRSAEIKNDESARDRTRLLADSSYPLRTLHRMAEAKHRIEAAFELLGAMKAWPTQSIRPGEEAGFAMRALADYDADTGRLPDAIEKYRELLEKVVASKPAPDLDLRDANSISVIEAALSALEKKAGHSGAAAALDRSRRERWQHWNTTLPNNSFILRQLASIP
jgi:tRNA A-37 threonylcarbamoyl transferase component Bud32